MDFIIRFISEDLIYALGWTVVHSIWQGLLIAIIMALVMQSMQKNSAKLRYEVASISLFLVFVFSLSTFILLYDGISQKEFGEITLIAHQSSENAAITGSFYQNTVQAGIDYFNSHLSVIVVIWLVGVMFFLFRLVGGLTHVQRLKYRNNQLLSSYWQNKLNELASRIPLRKPVKLLESSMVKVPMVIGYFKPIILMPVGAVNGLSENEVEAILAHELGHIFRNDFLMNIVLSFIEVLFYYHPAVWWISGNVRLERENCSDDIAIKLCGNSLAYAKALVTLQEMNHHPVPSFAMTFSGNKNQLLNRVKRILNQPQNRSNIMEKLTATSLLLVAIFMLSVGANTPIDNVLEGVIKIKDHSLDHFFPDGQSYENIIVDVILVSNDTVPENKRKETYRIITKNDNGEKTEFTLQNGELIELKVNGETIPKEEFENYEDMVDEMIINIPPAPPAPPAAPEPPLPPVAPEPFAVPAPPAAPVAPTALRSSFFNTQTTTIQTVTKGKNDDGQTIIVIETENGKKPMEIIIEEDGNVIMIDGNELGDGDTAIIIDEYNPRLSGYINVFPKINGKRAEANIFELDRDALSGWVNGANGENIWAYEGIEGMNNLMFDEKQLKKMREGEEKVLRIYKEQLKTYQNDLEYQSLEMQKLTKKQMKEISERLLEAQKLQKIGRAYIFETDNGKSQQFLFDVMDVDDNYEVYFEGKGRFSTRNVSSRIERELVRDGIIDNGSDYKLEINDKRMKVNGKKVSDQVFKKYKKIYERSTKSKMSKKSNLSINKKDN